jgi:cytochrome P450
VNVHDLTASADPYREYAALQEAGRVVRTPEGVLIHRYHDCQAILRESAASADVRNVNALPRRLPRQRHVLLNLDPPDHTRIRRVVSAPFSVRSVDRWRAIVRHHVDRLLDELSGWGAETDTVDLVAAYARPLPLTVITEMLGLPAGGRDELLSWTEAVSWFLEPTMTVEQLRAGTRASVQLGAWLRDVVEWKRRHPGPDVLTELIAASGDGKALSPAELIEQIRLFLLAGHQTVVNQIGGGTLALLRCRRELVRLVTDPGLDSTAVDELLRYDSPVQISRRVALAGFEIAGEPIEPGDLLVTLLGAANRDPERWGPTADRLDLGRSGARDHLSFGSGIHHCLGAAVARLEGIEAISALVRRFPCIEMANSEVVWNGRTVLRGLNALPVSLGAPRQGEP